MDSQYKPHCSLSFLPALFYVFLISVHITTLVTQFTSVACAEELLPFSDAEVSNDGTKNYQSRWKGTRQWIGPHWWANPLYDWSLRGSSVIGAAANGRNLGFLPAQITPQYSNFNISISIRFLTTSRTRTVKRSNLSPRLAAGFIIGRRGHESDFRRSLIYPSSGIRAGITARGVLFLGNKHHFSSDLRKLRFANRLRLSLTSRSLGRVVSLTLRAEQSGGAFSATLNTFVSTKQITDAISLFTDGPPVSPEQKRNNFFAFTDFSLRGNRQIFKNNDFGPILWSQYTLNEGTLRLQVQLAPVQRGARPELWGEVPSSNAPRLQYIASSRMDPFSCTAVFTVRNWKSAQSRRYEVRLRLDGYEHKWAGSVRKEPSGETSLKIAAFSCDFGYLFPHTSLVSHVKKLDPDVVLFLGDQIYEQWFQYGNTWFASPSLAMLDCIYKNMRFGWTWREVLRNRPSIIITDDHDVFHSNLWGDGGRAMTNRRQLQWGNGGYIMSSEWVRAAERIQVGHLPNPADNFRSPFGIKSYYTSMTYAGIGFAILEDRKFKSAPGATYSRRDENLLGARQERFLQSWAKNWTDQTMKIAVSQTIFASASTHQGRDLRRVLNREDSGGWPLAARNRVVKLLGDYNVLTIHGDQHLGMLAKQGVRTFGDAGYSFMVPGTANGWPRAWWPGVRNAASVRPTQRFTGKFYDDSTTPLTVLAVANPLPFSSRLREDGAYPEQTAYKKGSGFGLIVLNKQTKTAVINLFRVGRPGQQFDGFPRTIEIGGKPRNTAGK